MRILHYALGFPPYRTGGLTKYCVDLMKLQKKEGHSVALMWPGKISVVNKKVHVVKHKGWNSIGNFELINPLPVALDEGIVNVDAYIQATSKEIFWSFLGKYKPDVIHIHTLMGLYSEFINVANEMKIKVIYTSHDYFGICPKVTLFYNGKVCDEVECKNCYACNQGALSLKKIILLQSPVYRKLKNTALIKKMRKVHRNNFFDNEKKQKEDVNDRRHECEYETLRQYYIEMLKKVDVIHFNSSLTASVYCKYFEPKNYKVIPITHNDIRDNRKIKRFESNCLNLTYLGPAKEFKGFYFLISVLDNLWNEEITNFKLKIFTQISINRPYIECEPYGYNYGQLKEIFASTDLLVAPSLWYETFGFTVLEALSYGVPVLVSDHVGAKDIVSMIQPEGVLPVKEENFVNAIRKIIQNRKILCEYNYKICNTDILPKQLPYEELYTFEGESNEC